MTQHVGEGTKKMTGLVEGIRLALDEGGPIQGVYLQGVY
jgi:hypothetical protein